MRAAQIYAVEPNRGDSLGVWVFVRFVWIAAKLIEPTAEARHDDGQSGDGPEYHREDDANQIVRTVAASYSPIGRE